MYLPSDDPMRPDRGGPAKSIGGGSTYARRLKAVNRVVLLGAVVFVPLYIAFRLTGGSAARLQELPDLLGRLRAPVVWEVPEDGVRYARFFHAPADEGTKFVIVRVQMEARMKLGYPIVPRCFRLVDGGGAHYYPLSRSPMFTHRGEAFHLDRDDTLDEELLFQIPEEAGADRLTFERYQE